MFYVSQYEYKNIHNYIHLLEVCGGTIRVYEPFIQGFFLESLELLSAKPFKHLLKSIIFLARPQQQGQSYKRECLSLTDRLTE